MYFYFYTINIYNILSINHNIYIIFYYTGDYLLLIIVNKYSLKITCEIDSGEIFY